MSLKRWRIYCTEPGDTGWKYTDSATKPTTCPVNAAHSIRASSVSEHPLYVSLTRLESSTAVYSDSFTNRVNFTATPSKTIHISKEEASGQYTTIKAAIVANNTPGTIFIIHPGTYIEDNPITVPNECRLVGSGTTKQTIVVAANPSSDLISLGAWCEIGYFILTGASGSGSRGIYFDGTLSGAVAYSIIKECIVDNCDIGIESINGPDTLLAYNTLVAASPSGSTLSKGIYVHSGGQLTGASVSVQGIPMPSVPITDGIICTGATTKLSLTTSNIYYCTNGMTVDDNGEVELSLLTVRGNATGFCVGSTGTGSKIRANSLNLLSSTNYDLDIQAADVDLSFYSAEIDESKINNPNGIKFSNKSYSIKYNKKYQVMSGDIRFGGKYQKTTVSIGEGKYDDDDLIVLSNDNLEAGTWVDNTAAAKDIDPPTFSLFQDTITGNCCYIGRSTSLVGCKFNIILATSFTVPKDDIVWEYWDGSTWTSFTIMVTEAESPFYYKDDSVISYAQKQHVRFGLKSSATFVNKTLNGSSLKWVRMRIINAIPNIPTSQYVRSHVSETKIGSTGFLENFGDARCIKRLPWTINDTEPANASPANQDIYLSDKLGVGRRENKLKNDVVDRLGMNIFLPLDIDISFPLKLKFAIVGSSGTTGNVEFTCRWNTSNGSSSVYRTTSAAPSSSPGEKSTSIITAMTAADTEYRGEVAIDLSRVNPYPSTGTAQLLTVTIERDATAGNTSDTYPGDVSFIQITPFYMSWRQGGHIESF